MYRLLTAFAVFLLAISHSRAEFCSSLRPLVVNIFPNNADNLSAITFVSSNGGGEILVIFYKGEEPISSVFLIKKTNNSDIFCVASIGTGIGLLKNIDDWKFTERYGLPGSGYPRCAQPDAKPLPSLLTRSWANKELGESTILFMNDANPNSYTFLISHDNHWINIEEKKNGASCYHSRGSEVKYLNNSPRKNWIN